MSALFEELDRRQTVLGELSVRRRREPTLLIDVWEVALNDEHLMSSLFTVAEIALGTLGVDAARGDALDVVVGGLGLGYTAREVLRHERVRSMRVIEALGEIVEWFDRGLLPLTEELTSSARCQLVTGDFFAMVAQGLPFGEDSPALFHAILVDIDHTPHHVLHPSHASFYRADGLHELAKRLVPGGVFGLWSDAPPDADFVALVESVFSDCVAHVVSFPNFHTGEESSNTVYIATTAAG